MTLAFNIYVFGALVAALLWSWAALALVEDKKIDVTTALVGFTLNTMLWPWAFANVARGVIRGVRERKIDDDVLAQANRRRGDGGDEN